MKLQIYVDLELLEELAFKDGVQAFLRPLPAGTGQPEFALKFPLELIKKDGRLAVTRLMIPAAFEKPAKPCQHLNYHHEGSLGCFCNDCGRPC